MEISSLMILKKFFVVGSAVAEQKADPGAAMYSASKHALCGLVHSIQKEEIPFDLRLFSPGYMDTGMLPPQAWPRKEPGLVKDAKVLAQKLIEWYGDSTQSMGHWKDEAEIL
ncbi:MAG: SDR family NAD(P)-dependent oxidoreductase, partial [Bdellovibrionota bacterium]